jgi:hypothetical protein
MGSRYGFSWIIKCEKGEDYSNLPLWSAGLFTSVLSLKTDK